MNPVLTNVVEMANNTSAAVKSVADSVNQVTTAGQYIISSIAGLAGMLAHHVLMATLVIRFVVVWIVMGMIWHAGWTDYHSSWDFVVASIFLVGLGAFSANVGKLASAIPYLLPVLMLVDAGCFAFVDWFIPGMSSTKPIIAPLMYSFVLIVVQAPLNYLPC